MTHKIQIEKALQAINDAKFQDLINHLLFLKGLTFISAPGSVIAKEKTSKGAPDSFFKHDEKYIFVEYTTKEKLENSQSFFKKLEKDIEHCFDESITGIMPNEIEKVILAFTAKIKPAEIKSLNEKLKSCNPDAELELYSIQRIALEMLALPGLAEQYLNVIITKGDIFNLPDFLTKTTKGIQPSLTNEFVGREEEFQQAMNHLDSLDVILLSGSSGVGKSKLGVEILTQFQNKKYIPIVIQSYLIKLWDDNFAQYFQNDNNYIFLFDDANKSVINLQYVLNFITKPKGNNIKIVITARDYVKQKIYDSLNDAEINWKEVELKKLNDKGIENIIVNALPNLKYHYDIRQKIVKLSKGNPRIAMMATLSVVPDAPTNYLESPVKLYEEYFKKITKEIDAFSKPIILKTLAIVAFFGVIDRNNNELKELLEREIGIKWSAIWDAIDELHQSEILDMYENDLVKVSDQVLSTYAFFKCFIDTDSTQIAYSKWIMTFTVHYPERIRISLIDINNTFRYDYIRDLVIPHLDIVRSQLRCECEEYKFYKLFWFYKDYNALSFIKRWVDGLTYNEPQDLDFTLNQNNHSKPSKYFELLANFWNHSTELLKPSIELGIDLVVKEPQRLSEFLKFIEERFTYSIEDFELEFSRQSSLIDALLATNKSELNNQIASGTFLVIIKELLGWEYTDLRSSTGKTVSWTNFKLHKSTYLLNLRGKMLEGFITVFDKNKDITGEILKKIVFPGGKIDKEIYINEIVHYKYLIETKLSPTLYEHCKFVIDLSKILKSKKYTIPKEWRLFTQSEIVKIFDLIKVDLDTRKGQSFEEREKEKVQLLHNFVAPKSWDAIEQFLYTVSDLYKQQDSRSQWKLENAATNIFIGLANKSKEELKTALALYFNGAFSFIVNPTIIYHLLGKGILEKNELFELLNIVSYIDKSYWTILLLKALPEEKIEIEDLKILIDLLSSSTQPLSFNSFADLIKFQKAFIELQKSDLSNKTLQEHNVITYLSQIVFDNKGKGNFPFGYEFCQHSFGYFTNHQELFKNIFLYLKTTDNHFDYNGYEFEKVLEFDNDFLLKCIENETIGFEFESNLNLEKFIFDPLWKLDNYEEVIEKIILSAIPKIKYSWHYDDEIGSLFSLRQHNDECLTRIQLFISNAINKYWDNKTIAPLMLTITYQRFRANFLKLLKQFLQLNSDVKFLNEISFNRSESWTGSRVPVIQKKIDYENEIISMIKSMPNILNYIEHIQYFEDRIKYKRREIENEKRTDFLDF